ncbi:MAG: peptidoglycan endopeptidase [Novosphingobium sp.]|nr:peptidoglycan endopeptidase [Novosphingobium sp.]
MDAALAEAALCLVGVRFRLHGRAPETGLDCVGLVAAAMRGAGYAPRAPEGYSLRSASVTRWLGHAEQSGLHPAQVDGDVVLCMANPVQPHLLIVVPCGFVHAHAGLGRVTFLPDPLPWPITMQWHLADKDH